MTSITITDLETNLELDKDTLHAVSGGLTAAWWQQSNAYLNNLMGMVHGMNNQINFMQRTTHSPQAVANAFLRDASRMRAMGYTGRVGLPISMGAFGRYIAGPWG